MLAAIALFSFFTSARAAEPTCPDPVAELGSAENDIVSFFLSDAETSLSETVDAFGCSRPATAEDVARYMAIFNMVASEDGFEEGMRWVLTALLQSPHFLYRSELGVHQEEGHYTLNGYEIASELSYLLWGTMPDEELFLKPLADCA